MSNDKKERRKEGIRINGLRGGKVKVRKRRNRKLMEVKEKVNLKNRIH